MDKIQEAKDAVKQIDEANKTTTPPKEPEKKPAKAQTPPPEAKPEVDEIKKLREENEALKKREDDTRQRLEKLERTKAQVPPPAEKKPDNPLAQYSEDELIHYKSQNPEYAIQIEKELHRRTEERVEKKLTTRYEEDRQRNLYNNAAYEKWPDLRNTASEQHKLTMQIFNSDASYASHPQGLYVAAQAARTQILEKELDQIKAKKPEEETEQERLRLEAERSKREKALHGGGLAPETPASPDEEFEKSFEHLPAVRLGSHELTAHLRNLEKKKQKLSA